MLIQRFEPQSRCFTNFYYYYLRREVRKEGRKEERKKGMKEEWTEGRKEGRKLFV